MGASSSKVETPDLPAAPQFDLSKAQVSLPDVQAFQQTAADALEQARASAGQAIESANVALQTSNRHWIIYTVIGLLVIAGLVVGGYFLWPLVFPPKSGGVQTTGPPSTYSSMFGSEEDSSTKDLSIKSANLNGTDVTSKVVDRIVNGTVHFTIDSSFGATDGDILTVTYQYPGGVPQTVSKSFGETLDITGSTSGTRQKSTSKSWWGTGNQLPNAKDARQISTVSASSAPLSDGKAGSYGYQFWMYIKDWNYKFGQEKYVLSRSDSTNEQILNPSVTLHPTDNTMKISVSIFPTSPNSSKTEPAPAGHSGATDDVFICEVPNIPLQTWVCVSITVSSRNLDVYLNGNLVKSCVMTGVPKPAAGDIQLNKSGGFSGWMCSFYHYDKMLQPSDAQSFFASGVPCSVPGTSPAPNSKVTFGFFDTKGTEVSKFVF